MLEYIVERELSFVEQVMSIIVNNVDEQMLLHPKHVPKYLKIRNQFYSIIQIQTRKICKRSSRIFRCVSSKSSDERCFSITEHNAVNAATRI
jgi:hypothetical protein